MRFGSVISIILLMFGCFAQAKTLKDMSEEEQLGTTAGLALACGSEKKLEDFELISSRLIANNAATEEEEKQKIRVYMQAKWNALQQQKGGSGISCSEILSHFDALPLFDSIVYGDGSVKLPDGKWSRPKRPVKR